MRSLSRETSRKSAMISAEVVESRLPVGSSARIMGLSFAKARGAQVIGLTDGENSPFVGVADINLFAKSDMVSFVDSLVGPLSLINALIVAVGSETHDNLSETFTDLERVWDEYDVYVKNEN